MAKKPARKPATKPAADPTTTKADINASKKATFLHAQTKLSQLTEPKLHEEVKAALENKNYSSDVAARAADAIERVGSSGDEWLVKDLRSI